MCGPIAIPLPSPPLPSPSPPLPSPSPLPSPPPPCAVNTSMSAGSAAGVLAPGDVVEVCDGELMHLQGKVVGVDGDVVTVLPNHEDLQVCVWVRSKGVLMV